MIIIKKNIIKNMRVLIDACATLDIPLESDLGPWIEIIKDETSDFNHNLVIGLRSLWDSECIQKCFSLSHEFQLDSSAKYFFDALDRIADPEYSPTDDDLLQVRMKTTGIIEVNLQIQNQTVKIYDVGGQRSERKKWLSFFDGVTAVVFVTAISEFNQVLAEDLNQVKKELILEQSH